MIIEEVTSKKFKVGDRIFSTRDRAEQYLKRETEIVDETFKHNLVPGEWYYAPYEFLAILTYDQVDKKYGIFSVQFVKEVQIETRKVEYSTGQMETYRAKISRLYFKSKNGSEFLLWDNALINSLTKDFNDLIEK